VLPIENQLEAAQAQLEETRRLSEDLRRQTSEAVFKATPKNKMLTVTVGGQGELQSLVFRGDAYRSLAPAELAQLIVKTVEEARQQSLMHAMELIQELSPESAMPLDLMGTSTTLDDFMNNLLDVAGQYLPTEDLSRAKREERG
jgi:DNA-binding protein YbaB